MVFLTLLQKRWYPHSCFGWASSHCRVPHSASGAHRPDEAGCSESFGVRGGSHQAPLGRRFDDSGGRFGGGCPEFGENPENKANKNAIQKFSRKIRSRVVNAVFGL